MSGGSRFGGVNFVEKLMKDPDEGLVVPGTEDLCNKPTTFVEELAGKLRRLESQACCMMRKV